MSFRFLFGFAANSAGRAVSAFSRCCRSRAVFASRATRSKSVNALAASDVRSCLSCLSLSVKPCLSRIVPPTLTHGALLPHRTLVARSGSTRTAKKPAAPFGTAGNKSVHQARGVGGGGVPGAQKSYARRLRRVYQPPVGARLLV
ncbi:hypothetical protein BQ8482_340173 [Mesorhizobium delmotii]|uniref:Uncharacterized protein n=1 Tax=Mesorhizobium delmotii TaxID=1631247 RepID=A0A2P9AQ40_9HYPH|nr:hypothetical protein BQ8482_340173 [Mesorhizobium delmotii]